ncbi:hypothetical protein DY000_02045642 [Brassica cretica]|uniref:Auxin-responsive protein n=1 Tax=Brassica cretica TaxID=69181 RepID=A0ABQ7EQM5_BRACR|nr:hypothetical protein DY000_02045642 [Brassica cretica]
MAKFGKLTKLKSVIKKWPSFIKNHHSSTVSTTTSATATEELLDRSSRFMEERHDQKTILVACEVVLFEHLLWMLNNSCSDHNDDGDDCERGSVEELAEFYTY